MENPQKNKSLQKFRTAVRWMLIKLKLRKPKASNKNVIEENERDIHGTVDDSTIDLRTRSSSINSVISNPNPSISDNETVASGKSYERDGYQVYDKFRQVDYILYCKKIESIDYEYEEYSYENECKRSFGKRLRNAGSNFSKIPILSEIPKILNPAAWVSSKTQKDTKPIRN